jgi:hypothetical protein
MKLVVVEWVDIMTETGWVEDTDPTLPVFRTVGYLLRDNKEKVVICDTQPDNGTVTVFPKGCVLKIEEIPYGKGKENKQEQSGTLQELPLRREPKGPSRKAGKRTAKQ